MKKKKRYYEEQEILADIDRAYRLHVSHMQAAKQCDEQREQLLAQPEKDRDRKVDYQVAMLQHVAHRRRCKAMRIIEKRLPYLSKKLAEFRTMPHSAITEDRSIPA